MQYKKEYKTEMKTKYSYKKHLLLATIALAFATQSNAQAPLNKITEARITAVMKKMTLEEKIDMLHGNALFSSDGVKRLGIPEVTCDDGPLGVRDEVLRFDWKSAGWTTDSATFFPNGSAIAATWNPLMANKYGVALGEEANARKKTVMLAPAFNICRMPLCGRTYEYYSEDPYLNAQLAIQSVKGIQSQHVAACVKHYAANNQELDRNTVNTVVDDRTLNEIYLPAFKAAVQQGDAWSIMSAYNKVNGYWCSENDILLNKILKDKWGFKGVVISDWGGVHHTVAAANAGLDIEMGSSGPYDQWYFAKPLLVAVKAGEVSETVINDKVRRILRMIYRTSMSANHPAGSIATPAHSKAAYDIASESIVLLKNDQHLLPLKKEAVKSIAVIGDNATRTFALGGFGAGVKSKYEVTALAGIKARFGKSVDVKFAQGYNANYKAVDKNRESKNYKEPDQKLIDEAVAVAKTTDVAVLCIGSNREYESEGNDRKNLSLPFGEQALVNAVSAVNKNTIIVVMAGAPYDLNEIEKSNHTIVWSWFNGSEAGNALADVLTGVVNPSGKLPFTFPVSLHDSPAFALNTYPSQNLTAEYKEGVLVGYRWYDTKKIKPLYSFGYGLSYTTFAYSNLNVIKGAGKQASVNITLTNTGKKAGAEVVQVYVKQDKPSVERPDKELKAFKKIFLKAGESRVITLPLNQASFSYYDAKKGDWVADGGRYDILVGSSSADIKSVKSIVL
jgi:beta-glucosidase